MRFTETFINEHGAEIVITTQADEDLPFVAISIIGPETENEWVLSPAEAEVLEKLLHKANAV